MSPAAASSASRAAPAPAPDPLTEDLRIAFGELLGAERRIRSRVPQRPGSLSYAQVRSLVRLADDGEMTAGQLAKSADLTPASVTTMLDHLEEAGMVERRRSDEDRRVVVVALTERGRAVLNEKRAHWQACWREAVGDLPERDLRAAAEVMRRMARMFDGI